MDKLKQFYQDRSQYFQNDLNSVKKRNRLVSFLRLFIFLLAVFISIFLKRYGLNFILTIIFLALIPFLILVKINVKFKYKISFLSALIRINKKEILSLKGDFSVFPSGREYVDYNHSYSYDLDLFGQSSVFQMINRACTVGGSKQLAFFLMKPLLNKVDIENRQVANKELSALFDWRQNVQATGNIILEAFGEQNIKNSENAKNKDALFHKGIIAWLEKPFYFLQKKWLKLLLRIIPFSSFAFFILTLMGIMQPLTFIIIGLVQLSIAGIYTKKINVIHNSISKKADILQKYQQLLHLIESEKFDGEYLQNLQEKLKMGGISASKSVNKLKNLVKALDNRLNILFAFVANAYVLWDLQVVYRMEQWRKEYKDNLPLWLQTIYYFDTLSSLANFTFNHPNFVFPMIIEGTFNLEMKEVGHPLLQHKKRVDNDFNILDLQQIKIITGANMAGKSTFLRTVGVNMVLAMAGSVVCAQKFEFSPIDIHTSVRTNDSLQKNESYFFAELKRLKVIVDRLKSGEKLFVIVDEMLRGTNSKDKHLGSEALIKQLINLNASGLVATHDIALGKLEAEYPNNIKNLRFEVDIIEGQLSFDYKLKSGISENLNAVFLMKKMGIITS